METSRQATSFAQHSWLIVVINVCMWSMYNMAHVQNYLSGNYLWQWLVGWLLHFYFIHNLDIMWVFMEGTLEENNENNKQTKKMENQMMMAVSKQPSFLIISNTPAAINSRISPQPRPPPLANKRNQNAKQLPYCCGGGYNLKISFFPYLPFFCYFKIPLATIEWTTISKILWH